MSSYDCLSLLELLELRDTIGGAAEQQQEHLAVCPRCKALFENLPSIEFSEAPSFGAMHTSVVRAQFTSPGVKAGQIWIARVASNDDWRLPVVLLGRSRQRPGVVLVAPLATEVEQATDSDLVVSSQTEIGYPFFIAIWNFGQVYETQLEEFVGALDAEMTEELRTLYRHIAGDEEAVPQSVGPPVLSRADPRRIYRNELSERTRDLYAAARVEGVEESSEEESVQAEIAQSRVAATLGRVLTRILSSSHWDAPSLLESAHLDATQLNLFLTDHLDLTMKSDIEPLARTLSVLHFDLNEMREPIWNSLASSEGGWLEATGDWQPIAARSFFHVSAAERARDLFRDQVDIDESDEGKRRAIEDYWRDLVEKFDELSSSDC